MMERLTEKDQYSHDYKIQAKNLNSHCVAKDKKGYVTYYGQHIDKLAEYEDLEDKLNGISVKQVVDGFIKTIENQTCEGYEHGRILTNAEADKWNEYKQLEEQGLLLRLKCKVGDIIYFKSYRGTIVNTMVTDILIDSENIIVCDEAANQFSINDFGKTVFLTQAEAEQKLKEMERESE